MALTLARNMPSFTILPSNIPNMILAGAAEGQHGVTFGYLSYLALHYPVLMPGIGAVAPKQFNASVDFGMVLFVAAALAVGAVVNASGLGALAGGFLQDMLPLHEGATFANFLSLTGMAGLMGLVTTNRGVRKSGIVRVGHGACLSGCGCGG